MVTATPDSWKRLPLPEKRAQLAFAACYSDARAESMMHGFVPSQMEEKWFVFHEDGWLYFHRSWTGACIFALRLDGSPAGVRVIDSWVSRDSEHFTSTDLVADRKMLAALIDYLFPDEE